MLTFNFFLYAPWQDWTRRESRGKEKNVKVNEKSKEEKVKSTIPHEECWGTRLPYLGLEPIGG